MSKDAPLPDELQHIRNLIDGARGDANSCEKMLRIIIKSAADEAPAADVIRIAEAVLQCGIDVERSRWAERN